MIAQNSKLTVKDFNTKICVMPYLIDGHNLIPKIPGLSLKALDDEDQLIELLQEFCRKSRKEAEVFFDNAPPNGVRARNFGLLTARFVRAGMTADSAIRNRLIKMGRTAQNWTVVSSDHGVQQSARIVHAQMMPSETFARLLQQTLGETPEDSGEDKDVSLSSDELDDWMRLFGENQDAN